MNVRRTTLNDKVDFRWRQHETDYAKMLAAEAADAGRTESEQARELLKNALNQKERMEHAIEILQQELSQVLKTLRGLSVIKDGMKAIHENIYEFRDDLLTSVAKVLVDAGRLSPEKAEDWVKTTFNAD